MTASYLLFRIINKRFPRFTAIPLQFVVNKLKKLHEFSIPVMPACHLIWKLERSSAVVLVVQSVFFKCFV